MSGLRVLVAGAGLAGLSAARAAERRGATVTMIEARPRIGGRVWTVREGLHNGQHAEAGADIIEPNQQPVIDLARELGLSLVTTLKGGFGYYGPTASGRLAIQAQTTTFESIAKAVEPLVRDYRLSEQRWDGPIARRIAERSVFGWSTEHRLPAHIRHRLKGLRGLFLADPEELSMLALVDFLADGGEQPENALRIRGGNDMLATALASGLRARPKLQSILRAVRQTDREIVAAIQSDGDLDQWRGEFVVCALPATTLSDVSFDPPLPREQWAAIGSLPYGAATRVLLQFASRFWRRPGRRRAFGSDRAHGAVWEANEEQRGAAGVLSLLAGGRASAELGAIIEAGGIENLPDQLRWMGTPSTLVASKVVQWEREPWSRGGYAFFDTAFDPAWRALLARPWHRMVFAGEHTSMKWQGYMSGAIESGERAVAEIAAIASEPSPGRARA